MKNPDRLRLTYRTNFDVDNEGKTKNNVGAEMGMYKAQLELAKSLT